MKKVVFKLSTPNVGSWNGRWTGEGKNYIHIRQLSENKLSEIGVTDDHPQSWYYRWDDGWGANVSCRILKKGERLPKSDGFCGYEWMIDSILNHGKIMVSHEIQAMKEREAQHRVEHADAMAMEE